MRRSQLISYHFLAATMLYSGAAVAQEVAPATDPMSEAASAPPAAAAADEAAYGDIIVTAQKRSEKLSEVPLSITAATGDTLTKLGVSSAADLEKVVPGFTFAKSAYGAPVFTIRGIGFYDEAVAIAPTVSVYNDQVPVPFSRMAEGVGLDVERVEVLKGPQGTLFGQNSTGGAINYIARKPTDELEVGGDASYGRFNAVELQGYVSGPLSDTLRARVAGRYERSDDWQQSVTSNRTLGQRNFLTGRILLDWQPVDALKFELNVNGWRNKSDTQAPQFRKYSAITPTSADGADPRYNGFLGSTGQPTLDADLRAYPVRDGNRAADWDPGTSHRRDDWFYQVSLRGDLDVTDRITLTSISGYSRLKVLSPTEADGTRFLNLSVTTDAGIKAFTQELRLSGTAGANDQVKFMVGGNYERHRTEDDQVISFDGTNTGLFKDAPFEYRYSGSGLINRSRQKITTKAVFGSLDYDITDTLTAQGSIRYTKSKRIFNGCLRDKGDGIFGDGFGLLSNVLNGQFTIPNPGDPGYIGPGGCATLDDATNRPLDNVHSELPEHNVSWRTGLSWKVTPEVMIYGNVTRGYKSGSYGTLPLIRPVQANPIKQEKLTAYELGFKASAFDHLLDLTGAAFYYDYSNKQLLGYLYTGAVFGNLPGEVSIPKSRVEGAELSLTARPATGLVFSGAATYVKSKVTEDFRTASPDALYGFQPATDPACTAGQTVGDCGVNIEGSPFTYTPKWNLLADAQYTFPVSDGWNVFVGGNVTYKSSTFATFGAPPNGTAGAYTTADDYAIKGYALVDLRAGVESEDGKWRVQLWGRNVFNKYYWIHVVKIQDTLSRVTGRPVTYGVTVSARF